MLSIGIRFGDGFDKITVFRLMQSIPKDFDYDFVVIGSNPGGIACAREARLAGKKTAVITWKNYTPAEAGGFEENLDEMAAVLDYHGDHPVEGSKVQGSITQSSLSGTKSGSATPTSQRSVSSERKNWRKVRQSRLDLNNQFFKRGKQCRKLMHNATRLGDLVEDAYNSGWRVTTTRPPLTINWRKMSEEIMDYVMKENWTLASELEEESVEIIEGLVTLKDDHTVTVLKPDATEVEFTADLICLALPTECIFPNIPGAQKYGITCDDFIRLSDPPGRTLIVGSLLEGIECAGILARARFEVTVVSRSKILKGFDSEISRMIKDDLRQRGVQFKEETDLLSIQMNPDKKLMVKFRSIYEQEEDAEEEGSDVHYAEENVDSFDTVLFAIGRRIFLRDLNLTPFGIHVDPENEKIKVDQNDQTEVPHIYAVGEMVADCPEDFEISELDGKLLGKRLFHEGKEVMNYTMIPTVIYTPTEYAWVGLTEDSALYRLGLQCVDVYYGYFVPLDFVVPSKKRECFSKVIVLKSTEEIIGLHVFGPDAGEIIQGYAAAIRTGLTLSNFRTLIGVSGSNAKDVLKLKQIRTLKTVQKEATEEVLDS